MNWEWGGGGWFWGGLALALFAAEALLPGVFLLWLGLAAAALAVLVLVLPDLSMSAQWIMFGVLALIALALGWRLRGGQADDAAARSLNRRSEQLIGRVAPLSQAIVNGRGQVHIDDAYWTVEGPELAQGVSVRVVAAEAMLLRVVPA